MLATRFYYINSSDVANIYVDYIDIYAQMKRALKIVLLGLWAFLLKLEQRADYR